MATIEEEFRKLAKSNSKYTAIFLVLADLAKDIGSFSELLKKLGPDQAEILKDILKEEAKDSTSGKDIAAHLYGLAIENNLKSNIIFDDFIHFEEYSHDVGTPEWRSSISDGPVLRDPKRIRSRIIGYSPTDERSVIITDPTSGQEHIILDKERNPKGHTIYAYYQLQSAVAKSLINTEYFTYLDSLDNYLIYALLTEDIIRETPYHQSLMPVGLMDKLDEAKSTIGYRYSGISGKHVPSDTLKFLREFGYASQGVIRFRFFDGLEDLSSQISSSTVQLPFQIDSSLQKRLNLLFSDNEISMLDFYIGLLVSAKESETHINCFLNNVIYFKYYTKNVMGIDILFDHAVLGRIDRLVKSLKAFQPFDPNAKLLRDDERFKSPETIQLYLEKIKELRTSKKAKAEQEDQEKQMFYPRLAEEELSNHIQWYINTLNNKNSRVSVCGWLWTIYYERIVEKLFVELKNDASYDYARKRLLDIFKFQSYEEFHSPKYVEINEKLREFGLVYTDSPLYYFIRSIVRKDYEHDDLDYILASLELKERSKEETYSYIYYDKEYSQTLESDIWVKRHDDIMLFLYDLEKDNPEYDIARDNLKKIQQTREFSNQVITFINMLNEGNVSILDNNNQCFPNSMIPIGDFYKNNLELIDKILFKHAINNSKYDVARKTINEWKKRNFKDGDINQADDDELLKIFIEMLNEGNIEIFDPINMQTFKGTNILIRDYWDKMDPKPDIYDLESFDDSYNPARRAIIEHEYGRDRETIVQKLIEQLNYGFDYILSNIYNYRWFNIGFTNNAMDILNLYLPFIEEKLSTDLIEDKSYDVARDTLNKWRELNKQDSNKIEVMAYIAMLNRREAYADPNFNAQFAGSIIWSTSEIWNEHEQEIIRMLFVDLKDNPSYNPARNEIMQYRECYTDDVIDYIMEHVTDKRKLRKLLMGELDDFDPEDIISEESTKKLK